MIVCNTLLDDERAVEAVRGFLARIGMVEQEDGSFVDGPSTVLVVVCEDDDEGERLASRAASTAPAAVDRIDIVRIKRIGPNSALLRHYKDARLLHKRFVLEVDGRGVFVDGEEAADGTLAQRLGRLLYAHGPDTAACVIAWFPEDVKARAEALGIEASDAECEQIVRLLEHNHDAEVGISWDTIDSYLYDLEAEHEAHEEAGRRGAGPAASASMEGRQTGGSDA